MIAEITEVKVRAIVREETADLRADVGTLTTDVGSLKSEFSEMKQEMYRFGVLQEEMNSTLETVLELLSAALRKPKTN